MIYAVDRVGSVIVVILDRDAETVDLDELAAEVGAANPIPVDLNGVVVTFERY